MRRSRGLTLVEVLIALLVLGLVAGAFTTTVVSSLRMNSDDRIRPGPSPRQRPGWTGSGPKA